MFDELLSDLVENIEEPAQDMPLKAIETDHRQFRTPDEQLRAVLRGEIQD